MRNIDIRRDWMDFIYASFYYGLDRPFVIEEIRNYYGRYRVHTRLAEEILLHPRVPCVVPRDVID